VITLPNQAWHRRLLLGGVPGVAILAALLFWLWGGRYITTENAYVKADIAQVSAEVAGRVHEMHIRDHAEVKAGDVLLTIDPEPFRVALAKADAELDSTRSQLRTLVATWHEARSELHEAESKVVYWNTQLERQKTLVGRGIVASSKFEEVESNATAAVDRASVMRRKVERVTAQLSGNPEQPVDDHPMVREKRAERERAALDLTRTVIRAPFAGTAVNVKLQKGDPIKPATPLFSLVADRRPWVEANFKETELTYVRPGLLATVVLDIHPDVVWQAEVESISPATGAEFALLPPQNATGNWVKVVQRLPVRLRLLPQPDEPALRAGMTATVKIDTGRERHLSQLFGGFTTSATAQKRTDARP
jgi:membrane fusion protein, multidrug efflux system